MIYSPYTGWQDIPLITKKQLVKESPDTLMYKDANGEHRYQEYTDTRDTYTFGFCGKDAIFANVDSPQLFGHNSVLEALRRADEESDLPASLKINKQPYIKFRYCDSPTKGRVWGLHNVCSFWCNLTKDLVAPTKEVFKLIGKHMEHFRFEGRRPKYDEPEPVISYEEFINLSNVESPEEIAKREADAKLARDIAAGNFKKPSLDDTVNSFYRGRTGD